MSAPRCMLTPVGDTGPCGRTVLGNPKAPFCPVHDRKACTNPVNNKACGYRLITGVEERCPQCGASVKLHDVLKGGT